jgi:hypothetical protein
MGATELQSNWPEMRKTLGKPLVFERRGQEPNNLQIPWERRVLLPRATRNTTRAKNTTQDDSKRYRYEPS